MNLYLLIQSIHTGYDTFDSSVVAAESEPQARLLHPNSRVKGWDEDEESWFIIPAAGPMKGQRRFVRPDEWCTPSEVGVMWIGTAGGLEPGTIISSFNGA